MHARNATDGESRSRDILGTLPARTRDGQSAARQAVDGREREAFRFSVVPTESRERAYILSDLLLNVHPGSVLRRTVAPHSGDIRDRTGSRRSTQGFGIV